MGDRIFRPIPLSINHLRIHSHTIMQFLLPVPRRHRPRRHTPQLQPRVIMHAKAGKIAFQLPTNLLDQGEISHGVNSQYAETKNARIVSAARRRRFPATANRNDRGSGTGDRCLPV